MQNSKRRDVALLGFVMASNICFYCFKYTQGVSGELGEQGMTGDMGVKVSVYWPRTWISENIATGFYGSRRY